MNIYEFCERFRISLQKARKMQAAGALLLDAGESEQGATIRRQLSKGQPLTVPQLLAMIEEPSILAELGHYRQKAKCALAALGDVKNEFAPKVVAAYISDAARGDIEAVSILVTWLKQIVPAEPVLHNWISVRLLLGIPANIRKFDVPRIQSALSRCRKSSDFNGWWRVEKCGSRSCSVYQRPGAPHFDL